MKKFYNETINTITSIMYIIPCVIFIIMKYTLRYTAKFVQVIAKCIQVVLVSLSECLLSVTQKWYKILSVTD